MKRKQLLELLHTYSPSEQEAPIKEKILQFVIDNVDCFERFLKIGHITASCWLVNHDFSSALLMHHAKLNRWLQLGGHCDGDSDVLQVAIKEAKEESGIDPIVPVLPGIFDLDVHLIPSNVQEIEHFHYDIRFLLQVQTDSQPICNQESKELRWISSQEEDLPTQDPSVLRMFQKWKRYKPGGA